MHWKTTLFVAVLSISSSFAQDIDSLLFQGLKYRNVGPTRGGRVTAVAGIPTKPSTYYMGSTGGGVWKTTDYGQSWKNVSDGYFATPSIGAIRVSESNPDIVYVGTGSDGIRSNVITGRGVYKSMDAGKTWDFIGLKDVGQIGALEIHPQNPDTAFVAAIGQAFKSNMERGVFRTKDGGTTWEKVLFISDSTGSADLELSPDDPNTIYATVWRAERKPWTIISGSKVENGIYKSIDGGDTWSKLSNGLPKGIIGKIDLAVSQANPDRLWALIEAPEGEGGVYRSNDRGENFELVNTKKELLDRPFYYCNIDANPQNADNIFVNATQFWSSTDGGAKWTRIRTPHGDNHDMWINPSDSLLYVQSNDGGANVTRDGGKTWSAQDNQPTAELYQVEVDDQFPYWLYAGQQDNSTITVPSKPPHNSPSGPSGYWMAVGGCETGPAVPKPGNPDIVYSNCKGRFGVYNKKTGQEMQYYVGASNMYGHNPRDLKFRFQRVSPIHVSQHNPDVVYHASQFLHKTTDDGKTWKIISPDLTAFTPETQVISGAPITRDITGEEFYSTIYSVRESKIREGVIWVGANDGPVHVTKDGGNTWNKVTPGGLAPGGRVQTVEPSPHNVEKAYIAVYRYLLGDWKPYIFKTVDSGASWTLLTDGNNGIPADFPTRVVREDPTVEGLLYAGTEFGMFVSFDDGENWKPFQQNLPVTPITDIKVIQNDLAISTMGRSFWILDDVTPIHEMMKMKEDQRLALYNPRDSYRMRYRGNSENSNPHYPSAGVTFDYYLSEEPASEVTIEIRNSQDQLVRKFVSENENEDLKNNEPSMATGFFVPGSNPTIEKSSGGHRFTWDMRHNGPWDKDPKRSGRGGPMAATGSYSVSLLNGEEVQTQSFNILLDPRVEASGVSQEDLLKQEELALAVRDLMTEARKMANDLDLRREELAKKIEKGKASKKVLAEDEALAFVESELVTAEGRYMTPMLIDQIRYLSSMIDRADQLPGQDAYLRFEELKNRLEALKPDWEKYISRK